MLFRDLITIYGASLDGRTAPHDDPIWHHGRSASLRNFRQYALNALQQSKVYLLDHAAADYTDTLRDAIDETAVDEHKTALNFLGEVTPPAEVAWVEFDYRELVAGRVRRNSPSIQHEKNPSSSGLRGYLIDNRDADALLVTMFSGGLQNKIVDPYFTLRFNRSEQSAHGLTTVQPQLHHHMVDILNERGVTDEEIKARSQVWLIEAASDLFIPYALFAMLVSPDLGGIIPTETVLFSPKEMKTARKFGKSWIGGSPKSHLTIRVGPQAAAHMQERIARVEFERQTRENRNAPVRHWVSEHERHYSSGKVVLIKGHHRGQAPDPRLPTRVMGPQSQAVGFVLPPND